MVALCTHMHKEFESYGLTTTNHKSKLRIYWVHLKTRWENMNEGNRKCRFVTLWYCVIITVFLRIMFWDCRKIGLTD